MHPRGLNPGGTGGRGRTTCSVGDVLSLSPVATAFNWFSCPLSPRPPSPPGKGEIHSLFREIHSLFRRWLRPRHPGLNLRGTGVGANHVCGGEGVLSLSPVATAFNWFSCPLSPRPPSPAGKGEIYSYLMQGAPPLASPGLEPGRQLVRPAVVIA